MHTNEYLNIIIYLLLIYNINYLIIKIKIIFFKIIDICLGFLKFGEEVVNEYSFIVYIFSLIKRFLINLHIIQFEDGYHNSICPNIYFSLIFRKHFLKK